MIHAVRIGLGAVVVLAVLLLLGAASANRPAVDQWLEDQTGETQFSRQLNALAWHVARRATDTADFTPVTPGGTYPFGANTFFEQEVEEWKLRLQMEMLNEIGVRWIRQQIPWDRIELERGDYTSPFGGSTWDSYDRFIGLVNEYGLEMMARLDLPPPWARRDPFPWEERTLPQAAPRDFDDYANFVETFVTRYRGQVRYIQIWNEPNLFSDWGEAIDASRYTDLLCRAADRARAANPDIVIVSAAIAATLGTRDGFNQDDLSFLQQMYDHGAARCFDILATQGHGLWTGPGNPRVAPSETNFARVELIREIMVRNGDAHKPVWISELGWNAQPLDHPLPPSHGRVTPEQQARYTVQAYERAIREWPWVGVMFYWHFRRVHEENRAEVDFYYRMVDPDFTTQPVYDAFRAMTSQEPVMGLGFHEENHWAVSYTGAWQERQGIRGASNGVARVATASGDQLRVRFCGTSIQLAVVAGPQGGTVRWEITPAGGTSPVRTGQQSLAAPIPSPRLITLGERLFPGDYDLVLTVDRPEAAIDAFQVRNDPVAWLAPFLTGFVLAGAGLVVALLVAGRVRKPAAPDGSADASPSP